MACQAKRSGGVEIPDEAFELAYDYRLARSADERFVSQANELGRVEAGAKPFETHRGDVPIAIAAGPSEKVDLALQTFPERHAQLREQRGILARGSRESRVQFTGRKSHLSIVT